MKYKIKRLTLEDKNTVYEMFKKYVYELSIFIEGKYTTDINNIKYLKYLEKYLEDSDKISYILMADDIPVGFAFVKECESKLHSMEEFYIIPEYRRKKVGLNVSIMIFNILKGKWKISVLSNNVVAYEYWKNVVNKYTNGNYKEEQSNDMKRYIFYFNS